MALATAFFAACVRDNPIVLTPEQQRTVQSAILAQAPKPMVAVDAVFGGKVRLLGYDLAPKRVKPGAPFVVTWYWESLQKLDEDWMIFVHVDAKAGKNRMNLDHHAVKGLHNAIRWEPGQRIRDEQKARLPADFPPGPAEMWVGFWRAEDRLAATGSAKTDGHDRVLAGPLEVAPSKDYELPRLDVPRASSAIVADGKADEAAWAAAAKTGPFRKPSGKGKPSLRTEARLLWDDTHLHIAFECEDPDAWGTHTERDARLWEQEAVEVFLDPNGDGKTYAELQVSPAGVFFDASFPTYRSKLEEAMKWDSGTAHGVSVSGTLNKRDDKDKGWTVELSIPWAKLPAMPKGGAAPGTVIRANLFRLDSPAKGAQEGAAWSPPIRGDFHALDRFGHLTLK